MKTALFTIFLITQLVCFIPQIGVRFDVHEIFFQKRFFSTFLETFQKTNKSISNYKIEKTEQINAPKNVFLFKDVAL